LFLKARPKTSQIPWFLGQYNKFFGVSSTKNISICDVVCSPGVKSNEHAAYMTFFCVHEKMLLDKDYAGKTPRHFQVNLTSHDHHHNKKNKNGNGSNQ